MNSILTLNSNTAAAVKTSTKTTPTWAQVRRTLARKWDMIGVIGLMLSSAVYGIYALTQMTGF